MEETIVIFILLKWVWNTVEVSGLVMILPGI